jgi:hypothetical protein
MRLSANVSFSVRMSLLFAVLSCTGALAQNAQISGIVQDATGAVVPNARITTTDEAKGVERQTKTNEAGLYVIALPPSKYRITVSAGGFKTSARDGLTVEVGQNQQLNWSLEVGQMEQAVTVSGEGPVVNTVDSSLSGVVDDNRVVDLPLNGRNVMALAEIVPGVSNVSAPQFLSDARSGPTMNVNGGQKNMNLFTFDGGYFVNPSRNTGLNYPPPDAVQEFRILTANFTAEYGRNSGSEINVVSKAGTNQFHGAAWEFLRNDAFNARNFFSATVPAEKQNQFGGVAGGPIKRDKLFYFGAFQGLIDHPQAVPSEAFVPTAAERSGDFRGLGATLADPTDPLTGKPLTDPAGNLCVANNVIQPGCLSPASQKLLQFVPTSPSGVVTSLGASPSHDYNYLGRVDWNQGPKHTVYGHIYVDRNGYSTPYAGGGDIAGYIAESFTANTTGVTINDVYTFSPTIINQFVFSWLNNNSLESDSQNIDPATIGINMPRYSPVGSVETDVNGYFNLGSGYLTKFQNTNYQFRDAMNLIKGRHNFKFGGELLRLHFDQKFIGSPTFSFSGVRTGDGLADFMLGAYDNVSLDFGVRNNDDVQWAPSFFLQDEFRASKGLTLTLGIRYEPYFPWKDVNGLVEALKFGAQSTKVPDAPPGLLFPGDPGVSNSLVPGSFRNFAPRIGFAWDVLGDGKSSLRGSYGIFYDSVNADSLSQENPPFAGFANAYNGLLQNPFASAGQVTPPAQPSGSFGCVSVAQFPGLNCPLFPLPVSGLFVDPHLRTPYLQEWNLSIQRQLASEILLEIGYVGKIGTKLEAWRNYNPGRAVNDPVSGEPPTLNNVNNRVIYEPGILSPQGILLGNDNRSWYHGLQTRFNKRWGHGFSITGSYTFSKSIDTVPHSSSYLSYTYSNPFNLRADRGPSDFDRTHVFVASYLWTIPFHPQQRALNAVAGGWTIGGITTFETGTPLTFIEGYDVAQDGTSAGSLGQQHAVLSGEPISLSHSSEADMIQMYFNKAAFVNPKLLPAGTYGDAGRGILRGPHLNDTDFSLLKDFSFTERYRLQFRAEAFNMLNQVNFNNPNVKVSSGSFGKITSAGPSRVMQLALKFLW